MPVGMQISGAQQAVGQPGIPQQPSYEEANRRLVDAQAKTAIQAGSPINDEDRISQHDAARGDLFRQYHNGMNPGEHAAAMRQQSQVAGPQGGPVDPFVQHLQGQIAHPGYTQTGGTAIYQGNAGDGGIGLNIADRNAAIANQAGHQLGNYQLNSSNIGLNNAKALSEPANAELARAQGASVDPKVQKETAQWFGQPANRGALGAAAVLKGQDPIVVNNVPTSQNITPNNYQEVIRGNPALQGFAGTLNNDKMPYDQRVNLASQELTGDPAQDAERVKLFQSWMGRRDAEDPNFQKSMHQYTYKDPGQASMWTQGALGNLLYQHLGNPPADQARNQNFMQNMQRFGYGLQNGNALQFGVPKSE